MRKSKAFSIGERSVLDLAATGDVALFHAFFEKCDHPPPSADREKACERLEEQERELAACDPKAVISPIKSRKGLPEVASPSPTSPSRNPLKSAEGNGGATLLESGKTNRYTALDNATVADVVSFADRFGNTALHVAASNGHYRICVLLIDHGADVNAVTATGLTPLHCASAHGHLRLVELLLKNGANVAVWSSRYETPLSLALAGRFSDVEVILRFPTEQATTSKDALVAAANGDILFLLVASLQADHGKAAFNIRDSPMEDNMLHCVCKVGELGEKHFAFVRCVMEQKIVDIDATNSKLHTALMLAAKANNKELVALLMSHGANPSLSADPEDASRTAQSFATDNFLKVSLDAAERQREFEDVYSTRNRVAFSERGDFIEKVRELKRRWDEAVQVLDVFCTDNSLKKLW